MADALNDSTVQSVGSLAATPAVNEVAVAAADSWASIVLTTILIRGLTVPLLINQLKATTKLAIIRPRMEEIKGEMEQKYVIGLCVSESMFDLTCSYLATIL
ncbi:hypothetical protein MLD38_009959 [Melastoma candidum]|uniref:Uncharacterized protein n=1 Tax=Melastoma candidum TaxID=119954 RepID=A0ACB9R6M2_9MYRT|nr:hypothetical protein MLD38_009959 [Melastoma candidum]